MRKKISKQKLRIRGQGAAGYTDRDNAGLSALVGLQLLILVELTSDVLMIRG
jgi:hypothetical protein